jgi:hypothetical protein
MRWAIEELFLNSLEVIFYTLECIVLGIYTALPYVWYGTIFFSACALCLGII